MILFIPKTQAVHSADALLIKSDLPKGKATPLATGNRIRTGNGTEKSLVKLEPPERENAKAKNLESTPLRPGIGHE
ncbi:hypothetical protein ACFWVB_28720, partial [Streptomyces microflavus]|uniref:hypothetical protein n=3 Tax=Streptomyces TaxID=1883 RepID=UPI003646F477